MSCSVARTLDVVGEWWTPLIVRDLSLGISRFDAIQRDLGISRKVLAQRLERLVEHGVVDRTAYQDNPPRYDYRLTEKGADLAAVVLAMTAWGDRWVFGEDRRPLLFRHEACGAETRPVLACSSCGGELRPGELTPLAGPGLRAAPGTAEVPAALARLHDRAASG
jgi:DNA-binding HxlR family transcriptional regulator